MRLAVAPRQSLRRHIQRTSACSRLIQVDIHIRGEGGERQNHLNLLKKTRAMLYHVILASSIFGGKLLCESVDGADQRMTESVPMSGLFVR